MAAVAFDTLKLARALRTEAQMSAEQAEGVSHALAEAMSGSKLATKSDLAATEAALRAEISSGDTSLKAEIASVESSLRRKLSETKADILKSVMGMILGAVAVNVVAILAGMIGLAKLLGH